MKAIALGDLVDIKGGGTPDKKTPSYWDGDIPWASVKDFKGTEIRQTTNHITELGVKYSATNIIPAGNILVPTRMAVGKAAINGVDLAINQDLKALLPRENVYVRYLLHFLLAHGRELERHATGATVKGITLDVLRGLVVPLPPLEEQRRIAAILDQADALRRARQRSIDRLNQLGHSIFHEMFVENERADWRTTRVGDLACDIRTGPFGSQLLHSEFVGKGIKVLGIDNVVANEFQPGEPRYITEHKYQTLKRYTVKPGDVLITIMGTCGRCAIVPDDIPTAINTKHLCCITLDQARVLPAFLQAAFLQHPSLLKQLGVQIKGAVMPGLNMGIIKSLELPLPPLELQAEFASRIGACETIRGELGQSAEKGQALFLSLQSHAFRGEL